MDSVEAGSLQKPAVSENVAPADVPVTGSAIVAARPKHALLARVMPPPAITSRAIWNAGTPSGDFSTPSAEKATLQKEKSSIAHVLAEPHTASRRDKH